MKRALITGGGSGIGRTLAERFHDNGYAVTICGRKLAPLEDTAKGREIRCYQADVTSESDIEALFDAPYDIVVANAGGGGAGKLASLSLEEWNTTLAVNLTGTFLTFRQSLCRPAAQMRLIAIASTASLKGNASVPAYAAKHGVLGSCARLLWRWPRLVEPAMRFAQVLLRLRSRKMPFRALWSDLTSAATPPWTRSQLVIRNGV